MHLHIASLRENGLKSGDTISSMEVTAICRLALAWAKKHEYFGYSKFDALNSPILRGIAGKSAFLRSAFVFGMSRTPLNIRPLLLVRKKQNPKGLGLFARAYLNLYCIFGETKTLEEALRILNVLLSLSKRNQFSGHCWGYDHPWQNQTFFIPPYEPNTVVTVTVAKAFLHAYEQTGHEKFIDICRSVADFLLRDLRDIPVGAGMMCLSYDLQSDWKVINVNAITAAYLAMLFSTTGEESYAEASHAIMRWVVSKQTEEGAWFYTDPPQASRITIDNYHTGFILNAIDDYALVFGGEATKHLKRGLSFYKTFLFETDGAPRWMHNKPFPRDIHGCAQGILTFTRAARYDKSMADISHRILKWTLENLYSQRDGRFYYQRGRYWTKRFTLMRWCQSWMAYALSFVALESFRNGKK